MQKISLAVNGTLMRGLYLNKNLLELDAEFQNETLTSSNYRLWSIDDQYPAMIRDQNLGIKIELEVWTLSPEALISLLTKEPPGLCVGLVELDDGKRILGVLGEPYILLNQKEITHFGGWRKYINR